MNNSNEIQLSSELFEQIWSSSDLHPDRITHELNKIFIYNQDETQHRNNSQKYFTLNRDALKSVENQSQGGLHVNSWLNGIGSSINEIVSQTEIERRIGQQGIEIQWNGEKLIPKSFHVYKFLNIIDHLQVAIISKQLIVDRNNGAIIRTVSALNTPMIPKTNYLSKNFIFELKKNLKFRFLVLPEKSHREEKKILSKCQNQYLEEYISSCQIHGICDLTNKNLSDDDIPYLIEQVILDKQCQELILNQNSITDKGLTLLADCLRRNPRLELLSLNENKLTDRGILVLVNALTNENKNLSVLILEDLQLGTTAGIHLARMLTTNKTLTQLLLKNNQLKDRGMNAIAFALQNNISLTKLDVNNNHLTDRCFEAIMQLLSINRGLTELWLSDNEFSNETKEQFKNIEEKYGINLL